MRRAALFHKCRMGLPVLIKGDQQSAVCLNQTQVQWGGARQADVPQATTIPVLIPNKDSAIKKTKTRFVRLCYNIIWRLISCWILSTQSMSTVKVLISKLKKTVYLLCKGRKRRRKQDRSQPLRAKLQPRPYLGKNSLTKTHAKSVWISSKTFWRNKRNVTFVTNRVASVVRLHRELFRNKWL